MAGITWLCWILGSLFLGLGLLWLGLALFRDRARGRRRCPKCWYDMAGVPGLTCPECGKALGAERALTRTRRYRRQAVFAMIVVAVGYFTTRIPTVMEHGVFDVVPTPVLRVALRFFADDAEAAYLASGLTTGGVGPNQLFAQWTPQLPFTSGPPARPTPPGKTTTWQERIEADWENLLVASHARHLIYARIREGDGTLAVPDEIRVVGWMLIGVDDERRIAFDAVRALARRSKVLMEEQRLGVEWLSTMDFDAGATRRTLKSIARSRGTPALVRLDAIDALQGMSVDPADYLRALREVIATPDLYSIGLDGVAHRAVDCVVKLPVDVAVNELLTAIKSEHRFVRKAAVEGFQELGSAAEGAIPELVAAAKRENATDEFYALESLAGIGPAGAVELARLMGESSLGRRKFIIDTLRLKYMLGVGVVHPDLVDLIASDLLNPDVPFSRMLLSLARSGGNSMKSALAAVSVDPSLAARKRFILMYLFVMPDAEQYPEAVLAMLEDPDIEMRQKAWYELQHMGWAAERISIPIVDALARSTDPRDQRNLISLIRRHEVEDDRVVGLLRGRRGTAGAENLAYLALFTLEELCDDREVVIDEATLQLTDPYVYCRILAARVLAGEGAGAERALSALRAAMEREDPQLVQPAADAIEAISKALDEQTQRVGG